MPDPDRNYNNNYNGYNGSAAYEVRATAVPRPRPARLPEEKPLPQASQAEKPRLTIAPAAAIVRRVITLSKDLGVPLPWLRLSVVGNLSYETIAATNAESAMGLTFGQVSGLSARQYVTIASVMTVSIMVGIWLVPVIGEKLQNGMINLENRDKKWGEIFTSSMFIGMISAFIGYVFCDFSGVFHGDLSGLIPVCVMTVSALVMTALGLASKKKGLRVLADYALPVSLIAGMASAVPFTAWLG